MRITEAAQRLGMSPRMLRYRDLLGLLPPVRAPAARRPAQARHRAAASTLAAGHPAPATAAGHPATTAGHPAPATAAGHPATTAGHPAPATAAGQPAPAGPARERARAPAHRRFGEEDLAAVSLAMRIEQRYGISPAALAFGLRVLTEPGVRADVAELGRRIGRVAPPPARALDFEKQRAMRLLGQPGGAAGRARPRVTGRYASP
jgi:MerR family transcriptional regulator, copper efflux regulator